MGDKLTKISTCGRLLDKHGKLLVLKEIIGFMLYMHQQIPVTMQQLQLEFSSMKLELESKGDELGRSEPSFKPSCQRKRMGKLRKIKREIKKFERLMASISSIFSTLETLILEVSEIHVVVLALGTSSMRPLHIYEINFQSQEYASNGIEFQCISRELTRADILSKRVVRELISSGAGSFGPYIGPLKLFLLIKAPSNICISEDWFPKRDYKYNQKVRPWRISIVSHENTYGENSKSTASMETAYNHVSDCSEETIWFQCKHAVKGLPSHEQEN